MRFKERVAIVTGGARGIGAATVERLARDGAAVVIADLDEEPARELAGRIESDGGRALALGCDVSRRDSVEALFEAAIERFGHVDIGVLCAGTLRFNLIEDVSDDEWDAVIDTNLKGTFLCAQAAQRVMVPRRYGKLVLLSSGAARGWRARVHYSASKAGIESMTRVLASELGPFNINVNAVAPGFVETRMPEQHAAWLGEDYKVFKARNASQIPLRRVGTPEEQASVITFLCSDDASYVTGEVVSVSGGA